MQFTSIRQDWLWNDRIFPFVTFWPKSIVCSLCACIKSILLDWFRCLAESFLAFFKTCSESVDLHPEVCPWRTVLLLLKLDINELLLCQINLTKLLQIFCRGLMSAPSQNTLKILWDIFFLRMYFIQIFAYFWLNVSSLKIRPCRVNLNLRSLWKCICTSTMQWSIEGWGGKSSERELDWKVDFLFGIFCTGCMGASSLANWTWS